METRTIDHNNGHKTTYKIMDSGTAYHIDTPERLVTILEQNRVYHNRIKIYYGDVKTGKLWGDVEAGYIGRSNGSIKVPLCIYSERSHVGGALLDHCIVRIEHANKKQGGIIYEL